MLSDRGTAGGAAAAWRTGFSRTAPRPGSGSGPGIGWAGTAGRDGWTSCAPDWPRPTWGARGGAADQELDPPSEPPSGS